MDGAERRQEAERVAADVAEDARILVFAEHLVQGCIDIAVATALAECGWARSHVGTGVEALAFLHAQRLLHDVGVQLARAGQRAVELTLDVGIVADATDDVLDEGLTLLDDEHLLALIHQAAHQLLRQRVLRYFQNGVGASVGEALVDVVVAYAAGQNAERLVLTLAIYIIGGVGCVLFELSLLGCDYIVALAGVGGEQYPVGSYGVVVEVVLLTGFVSTPDDGAAVGHAGSDAHQHGQALFFGVVEGGGHHVVSLLLVRRLERGDEGELAVEA